MRVKNNKDRLEFNVFYKTLVPVLRDYGIELTEEQAKKFIRSILLLIGLFCVKNPDKYFQVGKLLITRNGTSKNNVVSAYLPTSKENLNSKILDEFSKTLICGELGDLIKGYFKSVVEGEEDN